MHEMRIWHALKGADHRIEENTLFGKYRIISTLGTGSSSTVYLAEHLKLKIYRAIKCIPKGTASAASFSFEDSFPTEASLLKNLNHPGIPLIYDIDEDDTSIYMIEEYIQGESLDTFVSYQENISQELIIQFGIQICDILDYLHHLSPYPILYQDLKPEHIIVCRNQLKLIDFGIASFFTNSGNQFQFYGTGSYAAPEALNGLPVNPSCDVYSLGKILEYMTECTNTNCSDRLLRIIQKASALPSGERFKTADSLKRALLHAQNSACRHSSYLIRNIAITGSKPGVGATHFAVSLVSSLNKKGTPAIYTASDTSDSLFAMTRANLSFSEQHGIYSCRSFQGIPSYGDTIENAIPADYIQVQDFGFLSEDLLSESLDTDLLIVILSGSDWDIAQSLSIGNRVKSASNSFFVCNYGNRKAARKFAKLLGKKVYCFPCDPNPYGSTPEKDQLISAIFEKKGGKHKFLALIKRNQNLI